jgi:hypothetical protein
MASFVLRPSGTYVGELDLALQAKAVSTSIGVAVITSRRGPEEDKFITRVEVFDALYGPPDASWSFAHYCCRVFLKYGQGLWVTRVTNSAKYAGSVIFNNQEGALGNATFFKPFTSGRYSDYQSGSQRLYNIGFSSALQPGQTVSTTFSNQADASNAQTVSVTFDGTINKTADATMAALASAIQASMNNQFLLDGKSGGQAFVNTVGVQASDDRILTVIAPEDNQLYFGSFTVTNGTIPSGQPAPVTPALTLYEDGLVMEVYAQNRGKWASDPANSGVGYRLSNPDNGTNQRILLQFSAPLVTGQQLSIEFAYSDPVTNAQTKETLNVPALGTQSVNNQLDAVNNLIEQFQTAFPGGDGYILDDTDLQVVFVAPEAGPNTLSITNYVVKNNQGVTAPLPSFSTSEWLEGIAGTQTFEFEIYTPDDLSQPKESFTVSLIRQTDGNGNQLYVEDVMNNNSTGSSSFVRVRVNPDNLAGILNIPEGGTDIQWLSGGDDGVLPTSGDLIRTWDHYKSRQKRPARIFINCGYTALSVQQKISAVAKTRYDAIAILDFPSDKMSAQAAYEYRTSAMNLNTSYAAIYVPNIKITDEINNKDLFVPPSGHMAAVYANTDNVAASWFAPAGLNRAIIEDCIGLQVEYDDDEQALLISCQLNPIINRGGDYVAWEQFTALRRSSPFQNVSLRRMLILIEVSVVDGLDYTIHEPNDEYTGMLIVQIAVSILQPIKQGRGLYAYAAISDDRNNTDQDYNRQNRNLDLLMDPILPIRTIQLTSVITNKGASFSEVLNALTGNLATSVQ